MPMSHYRKGAEFERKIRAALEAAGYAVGRGAGSKGTTKSDLIAFSPHGTILIVQAKTNGVISADEWNRLFMISEWSASTVPVIGFKSRGKALDGVNKGGIVLDEITGYRVRGKPLANRVRYEWRCGCVPPHDDLSKIDN